MKRFTKIMLIAAGILLILGLGFAAYGAAMGGLLSASKAIRMAGKYYYTNMDDDFEEEDDWDDDDWEDEEDHHHDSQEESRISHASMDGDTKIWEFSVPEKLEAELACEEVVMEAYRGSTLKILAEKDSHERLSVQEKGDKVKISSNSKRHRASSIHIYYPEGSKFQKLELAIYAGEASLKGKLTAEDVEISAGAGTLTLEDGLAAQKCEVTVGMGEASLFGVDAEKIQGECGVGTLSLVVAGKEEDYDYDMECGVGSIVIGDDEYGGFATEKTIHNKGERKIDLECGMGEIQVDFRG